MDILRRLNHQDRRSDTSNGQYLGESNPEDEGSSLSTEIEIFFGLLFVLLAVIAVVKIREHYDSQAFRYEPL